MGWIDDLHPRRVIWSLLQRGRVRFNSTREHKSPRGLPIVWREVLAGRRVSPRRTPTAAQINKHMRWSSGVFYNSAFWGDPPSLHKAGRCSLPEFRRSPACCRVEFRGDRDENRFAFNLLANCASDCAKASTHPRLALLRTISRYVDVTSALKSCTRMWFGPGIVTSDAATILCLAEVL